VTTYIAVYLGAVVLALVATPLVIRLARRVGAVDRPGVRTVHERPTPRIGGVAIFGAAMAMIGAVLFLDNAIGAAFRLRALELATLLCAATFIFLIGLADDLKGLPARVKFGAELGAAIALCVAGVRIEEIALTSSFTLPLGPWGCLLTILWVVGITNAVNLSDGLDGLAAGVSAVACAAIAIFAVHSGQVIMAVFMLALLGSLSGFLVFNFNPARIFMGDCGSLFLGFIIAASSVLCVAKSAAIVGLALPALALGVPIFDTLFSMLRRFLESRSLFAPDRRHVHHRLLGLGLSQRHAVLTIYLFTALIASLGLFMLVRKDLGALLVFGCLLLLVVLAFRVLGVVHLRQTIERLKAKQRNARTRQRQRKIFENLQLQFRRVDNAGQWGRAVCDAAKEMDFAYVALKTVSPDGKIGEEIWRAEGPKQGHSRIVTMTVPLPPTAESPKRQCEIAIWTNGSLEDASRRATLFGRLMDEGQLAGRSQPTAYS